MVDTRIYQVNELDSLEVKMDIKEAFMTGKNVVFPTETVYGIGANALDIDGIKGIYEVKGRPSDNPLIMHVSKEEDVFLYTKNHQPYVRKMMDHFWPGPLTMVFEKNETVPDLITGGLSTVGVRIPGSAVARKVIEIAGVPVCAPSANISGRPSSTLFEHVYDDFYGEVDIIIDGGKSAVGLESTVVDVTGVVPIVLRPGMITAEMIKNVVGDVLIEKDSNQNNSPKSPGMKYKHYAPVGEMLIVDGQKEDVINYINRELDQNMLDGALSAVITTSDLLGKFHAKHQFSIGDVAKDEEIASNLFMLLRKMDQLKIDKIYSVAFHGGIHEEAIMNRLLKAANGRMKKV
ncbi:MAG: L-threonylcarbamoyladenylate synthase [Candidatus Izemoplasmataceae bacterium]